MQGGRHDLKVGAEKYIKGGLTSPLRVWLYETWYTSQKYPAPRPVHTRFQIRVLIQLT